MSGDADGVKGETQDPHVLEVYELGEVTVVGFGGRDVPDDTCLTGYRKQLAELIEEHKCRVLAFDLTGVVLVPSGLLGLIASMRQLGVEVQLFNPSDDVREVLSITQLDQAVSIREVT